jgi:hypothetical protein
MSTSAHVCVTNVDRGTMNSANMECVLYYQFPEMPPDRLPAQPLGRYYLSFLRVHTNIGTQLPACGVRGKV